MKLDIKYENDNFIIINKPALVHSSSNNDSDFNNSISFYLHKKYNFDFDTKYNSGLINRLDFSTSGILLAAKNKEYFEYFLDLRKNENINKKYSALVSGQILDDEFFLYFGSRYRGSKKISVSKFIKDRYKKGSISISNLEYNQELDYSLISTEIQGGRRHQIRASLEFLDKPLVGDTLYKSTANLNLNRDFYLDCYHISFNDKDNNLFEFNLEQKTIKEILEI